MDIAVLQKRTDTKDRQFHGAVLKSEVYPSLFNCDSDEEFSDDGSDLEDQSHVPLLHISDVIHETPKTLSSMLEILLPRMQPHPKVKGVSMEDQQGFSSILIGELGSQFSLLHHQIDDPFLDAGKNKKLHWQVSLNVCKILEQLYSEYIYKAAILSKSALSLTAGMSKLRAELIIEVNKRLNIPAIRKEVLDELRGPIVKEPLIKRYCQQTRLPPIPKQEITKQKPSHKQEQFKIGKYKPSRFEVRIESGIVKSRLKKLKRTFPVLFNITSSSDAETDDEDLVLRGSRELQRVKDVLDEDGHLFTKKQPAAKLHRVSSLPELWGEFLLCDIGSTTRHKKPKSIMAKEGLLGIHRPQSIENFMDLGLIGGSHLIEEGQKIKLGDYTLKDFTDDLHSLEERSSSKLSVDSDDIHPLLQAHGHGLSKARRAELEASRRREKEKEEAKREEEVISRISSLDGEEQSIPSVTTPDQLPYITMQGTGSLSSLCVKSVGQPVEDGSYADAQMSFPSVPGFGAGSDYLVEESVQEKGVNSLSELGRLDGNLDKGDPNCSSLLNDSNFNEEIPLSPQPPTTDIGGETSEKGVDMSSTVLSDSKGYVSTGVQPQTAVVTAECPGGGIVRTADVRVSMRTPLTHLRLKSFGPIYNLFSHNWNSSITSQLDSNLYEGKEVTALYQEITSTLSTDHLKFDNIPTLEPTLDKPVELSNILASRTLLHRRSHRVINRKLHQSIPHPWENYVSREEWEQSNEYKGTILERYKQFPPTSSSFSLSPPHFRYVTWLNEWKATVNSEDFLKFVSKKESDYLRLVYHIYDSDGGDSEAEEEARERKKREAALHAKLRAKEERKRRRYMDKNHFQNGMWNVNTVTMGGLGRDPHESSSDDEDADTLRTLNEKASTKEAVQNNLNQVWARLYVPQNQQMDMAIKYSGDIAQTYLNKVLSLWEEVCDVIELRESALLQLESFEKKASDPSRFFAKGQCGSASLRLKEARLRDKLHNNLDKLDKKASFLIQKMQKECGENVTYKGRSYSEKMRLDRTEMLYWLQQARREAVLKPAVKTLKLLL